MDLPVDDHPLLVGIDVGGTFTDFVVLDNGKLSVHKIPTTPEDQSRAIVSGLETLEVRRADVVHGMTVATNALLERSGARTALLTTEGFADAFLIGRQNRPQLYRFSQKRPESLVEERWRLEAPERVNHCGDIVHPLDESAVARVAGYLADSGVESLAIVLLFSFRNPQHEQRAAEIIRTKCPDLLISISSNILPEYREYERMTTTVINAYVQPLVGRYLRQLGDALDQCRVRIMQSNGGAIGLAQAADQAARVVLSGPAGGVVGAFAVAQQALGDPSPQLITFDMGGTSTDVALCPGAIPTTAESTITGLPLRLPVIDIHTVGAGGGSIAYIDAGGGLHVGPRSAGAVPGPACYGHGGSEPTVTDANLVLGRLDPGGFLGGHGDVALHKHEARRVLEKLGQSLGMNAEEAALGIVRIANATMERALRRVSVEQGHDPRGFTMLPFGGAGPLHACDLADALGIHRILVPPIPGVLSAYGMLVADIANDASQTVLTSIEELSADLPSITKIYQNLAARVRTVLQGEGVAVPHIEAAFDMRYKGQSYELTVPLVLPVTKQSVAEASEAFHRTHERRYGYAMSDEPVEVVNLRVRGTAPGAQPALPAMPIESEDAGKARLPDRPVWFDVSGSANTMCYDRARLRAGNRFPGPAIVHQFDATLVVMPGWYAQLDRYTNIWLEKPRSVI